MIHREAPTLTAPRLGDVLEFCADEPVERVLLEDVARRGLGRFSAVYEDGRLTALCHVGTNLLPAGRPCSAFAAHVLRGNPRMIIGEERAVGALWETMRPHVRPPREDRPGQPVYSIAEPPEPGRTGVRAATADDLELLVPACAAAHAEEIGVNPLARDADGFRWRTRAQIDEGRSWIWVDGETILFKAEASAWTPSAVQIQQVWVDPAARGRGYAQRGMRDLCRLLLRYADSVCLFVRSENATAIHVYEAIGMREALAYRSVIF